MPEELRPNPPERGADVRGLQTDAADQDLEALLALSSYQAAWRAVGAFDKSRARTVLMAALLRLKAGTGSDSREWMAAPTDEARS